VAATRVSAIAPLAARRSLFAAVAVTVTSPAESVKCGRVHGLAVHTARASIGFRVEWLTANI
jgi:hypothetical protein